MPHKRSSYATFKRQIRQIVLSASYWDKRQGECISTLDAELLDIVQGEVLYDARGHRSPGLDEDR
jgi:hypothetical protein